MKCFKATVSENLIKTILKRMHCSNNPMFLSILYECQHPIPNNCNTEAKWMMHIFFFSLSLFFFSLQSFVLIYFRQISMLFRDNKDSIFCILSAKKHHWCTFCNSWTCFTMALERMQLSHKKKNRSKHTISMIMLQISCRSTTMRAGVL